MDILDCYTVVIILKESIRVRADNKRAVLEKIELL